MYTYSFVMQKISADRKWSCMDFPKEGAHGEMQCPWEVQRLVQRY